VQKDTEYALFLEQAGKLAERRQSVTSTYLTVNAAVVGAIAFILKDVQMVAWEQQLAALLLLIVGIVACSLWRRLIAQHSALLRWWYERLRVLEEAMPESSRLLTQEYQDLYVAQRGRVRIGLTRHEVRLTWLFTAAYAIFGLVILALLVLV